jgi:hypothetical protein
MLQLEEIMLCGPYGIWGGGGGRNKKVGGIKNWVHPILCDT